MPLQNGMQISAQEGSVVRAVLVETTLLTSIGGLLGVAVGAAMLTFRTYAVSVPVTLCTKFWNFKFLTPAVSRLPRTMW